jgi:hypothetical protein
MCGTLDQADHATGLLRTILLGGYRASLQSTVRQGLLAQAQVNSLLGFLATI